MCNFCFLLFSNRLGYFLLLCFYFQKALITIWLQKCTYDLSIVFYLKSIVPLHQEINNNRYEAKTTYTPFTNYRSYGCATGFNDCISSMQYAWHTNEFTAICYGYRIYHPKTKLLYHLCIIVARYIIEAIPSSHFALANEKTDTSSSVVLPPSAKDCVEVQKKRMELFHYEYQREQQQYQLR